MPLAGCGRASHQAACANHISSTRTSACGCWRGCGVAAGRRRPYPGLLFLLLASAASPRTRVVLSFMPATRRETPYDLQTRYRIDASCLQTAEICRQTLARAGLLLGHGCCRCAIHAAIRAGAEPTAARSRHEMEIVQKMNDALPCPRSFLCLSDLLCWLSRTHAELSLQRFTTKSSLLVRGALGLDRSADRAHFIIVLPARHGVLLLRTGLERSCDRLQQKALSFVLAPARASDSVRQRKFARGKSVLPQLVQYCMDALERPGGSTRSLSIVVIFTALSLPCRSSPSRRAPVRQPVIPRACAIQAASCHADK